MDRFTVDPTLAVTTRPRGGDWLSDELSELCRAGVDVLVSCLTPSEEHELELSEEADLATNAGMEFIRAPIADFGVPADPRVFDAMVELLLAERRRGASIAVHCRQGIGRSPLVVASVLVREGETPERAWVRIADARRSRSRIPTPSEPGSSWPPNGGLGRPADPAAAAIVFLEHVLATRRSGTPSSWAVRVLEAWLCEHGPLGAVSVRRTCLTHMARRPGRRRATLWTEPVTPGPAAGPGLL